MQIFLFFHSNLFLNLPSQKHLVLYAIGKTITYCTVRKVKRIKGLPFESKYINKDDTIHKQHFEIVRKIMENRKFKKEITKNHVVQKKSRNL